MAVIQENIGTLPSIIVANTQKWASNAKKMNLPIGEHNSDDWTTVPICEFKKIKNFEIKRLKIALNNCRLFSYHLISNVAMASYWRASKVLGMPLGITIPLYSWRKLAVDMKQWLRNLHKTSVPRGLELQVTLFFKCFSWVINAVCPVNSQCEEK